MSIGATVSAMTAAGCSAEQINAVVQAYEAERVRAEEKKRAARRAGNAERQRRLRDRRHANNAVTERDDALCGVTERDADPATSDSAPMRVVNTNLPSEDISLKTKPSVLQKADFEKSKSNRGSRLPADWMPDDAGRAFAAEQLGNSGARAELAKFRDWAASVAGAKGVKADWNAAWRNWVRKAAEDAKPRAGPFLHPPQEIRNPPLRALQRLSQKNAQRTDEQDIFAPRSGPCQPSSSAGNPGDETGAEAGRFGPVLNLAAYR